MNGQEAENEQKKVKVFLIRFRDYLFFARSNSKFDVYWMLIKLDELFHLFLRQDNELCTQVCVRLFHFIRLSIARCPMERRLLFVQGQVQPWLALFAYTRMHIMHAHVRELYFVFTPLQFVCLADTLSTIRRKIKLAFRNAFFFLCFLFSLIIRYFEYLIGISKRVRAHFYNGRITEISTFLLQPLVESLRNKKI